MALVSLSVRRLGHLQPLQSLDIECTCAAEGGPESSMLVGRESCVGGSSVWYVPPCLYECTWVLLSHGPDQQAPMQLIPPSHHCL